MSNTKEKGLSEKQKKALEDEMRNNQAVGKRATVAINLLPSIIKAYPNLSEEEMIDKATRLTELAMDKLLGVKFEPKDEKE